MANTKVTRRQRGSIRPNGAGFQVRVYAGSDPLTKKPLYLHEQAATLPEAEKARTRLLAKVDEQRHPKGKITVAKLLDQWMDVARIEESTRDRYVIAIDQYLKPTFGELQAAKLGPQLIELFYARLTRCREQCEGKLDDRIDPATGQRHECRPLSNAYLRKLHYILKPALQRAVVWGYLGSNPMDAIQAPPEDDPEPDPPSNAEVATILNDAWRHDLDWGTLLFLIMVTGCRRGELCGLRWQNVDFDTNVITVRRATGKTNRLKKTKTGRIRRVAIDMVTADLLKAHLARRQEQATAFGAEITPDSYVFSLSPDSSEPIKKGTVTQRYGRLARRNKLRSTRLQSLRDYSVTELLVAGVDIRTVSGRHGHSRGATTLRHYAAWVHEADRRASEILPGRLPVPGDAEPLPLAPWEKVTAELREAIEDGTMPPGSELPTIVDLSQTYEISVGTAHRCFAQLKKEGLITVSPGRRAVVQGPGAIPTPQTAQTLTSHGAEADSSDVG
ncbi:MULTISPECIES: tyrosine-type recombinase/integrase [Streptomyces]|uniref:tyrosine-type recombinase/integrase n=1 Tax=Streptomyces lycopersici TaxID=2974589 RepID=UPI0021CF3BC0|nr:tyrosine-type recombinase/integrase [Streptomyces sp. NEAU-383]